jgi:hypothetical protein
MTSFGIEWETQEIIYYNPKYLLNGKGIWSETVIDNSEQKCNIACEQWEGADEYDPELCTHNLEVRLGVFYGNTNTFNTYEFTKACDKFMTYWKDIIKQKKITIREIDHDIFTRIINPSDTGDTYYTTCKAVKENEGKNSYPTTKQEKYEWAYTQNLQLTGIPQITIGVQYKYVFHLFKFIYDKLKNPATNVENIRSYYYLKNISRAFIDTVNDISENDPVDVIIFILLCNNHIISEKETAKYRKSSYIFKVRTNLGNMYASLEASSKKRITEWKENKLNSFITPRQQEILNNIFVENKGYVLENDEQFKKV